MKKVCLLSLFTIAISGELSVEGEFTMYTTPVFAITVEETTSSDPFRTMAHEFTASEISDTTNPIEMGQFNVHIVDTTSRTGSNYVRIQATVNNGSTMQIQNITDTELTTNRLVDLYVTDDKNTDGSTASPAREITNNSNLRVITTGEGNVDEQHEITVNSAIGALSGKANGNYRVLLFFTLVTS